MRRQHDGRKSASDAMAYPLFVSDPARWAEKLNSAGGLLWGYWADLQRRIRDSADARAQMVYSG
jgi:hypothetical protein